VIELRTTGGQRCLRLGEDYRVERSAGLHAELDALLGGAIITASVAAAAAAGEPEPAGAAA
jgi:hypothetical protein